MFDLSWEFEGCAAFAYLNGELVGKVERDIDLSWMAFDLRPEATEDVFAVRQTQQAAMRAVEARLRPPTHKAA